MIQLSQLRKSYQAGALALPILRNIDLSIGKGEFVAIMGPSGSGKSTLLNVLGILDNYDAGEYRLNGQLIRDLSPSQSAECRNRLLGFVFQSFNLLPYKTALENVALPLYYQRVPRRTREAKAKALLERMGLHDRMDHQPNQLSGGQRQRVAIARALINDPPLLLADEPTGNLDSQTTVEVIQLLKEIHALGQTLVMVTHDENIAAQAQRIIRLQDGQISGSIKTR
jgi:putative ABC transport system ATP-binding protein